LEFSEKLRFSQDKVCQGPPSNPWKAQLSWISQMTVVICRKDGGMLKFSQKAQLFGISEKLRFSEDMNP